MQPVFRKLEKVNNLVMKYPIVQTRGYSKLNHCLVLELWWLIIVIGVAFEVKLLTHLSKKFVLYKNDFFYRILDVLLLWQWFLTVCWLFSPAVGVDLNVIGHRMGQQGGEECRDCCYKSAATVAATAGYLTITRANTEGTLSLLRLPGVTVWVCIRFECVLANHRTRNARVRSLKALPWPHSSIWVFPSWIASQNI